MTILTGDRLELRDLVLEDWPAIHAYASRAEVVRYQPWGPNTSEESRAFVERVVAAAGAVPRKEYQFAVRPLNDEGLVGVAKVQVHSRAHGQGEISYVMHPDVWGRGYATEAARLVLAFGFEQLGLHRIFGTCDPRNVDSARVLEKIGMVYEGRMRETLHVRDGWRDSLLYSILADEWRTTAGVVVRMGAHPGRERGTT